MNFVPVGSPIPIAAQLGSGDTDLYVRAFLTDQDGTSLGNVDLTHLARGLYWSASFDMPNTVTYVNVQCIAYTDSGYSTPAKTYIAVATYSPRATEGAGLNVGDPVPAVCQLGRGDTDKYPRAWIYDDQGNQITGSPVALAHVANGLYNNDSLEMPDTTFLMVQVQVFDDSGFTTPSNVYAQTQILSNLEFVPETIPECPDVEVSVAGFKNYFVRDFPYGNTMSKVMDQDIRRAISEATCYLNSDIFCSRAGYNEGLLLLAAHFLVENLRASSQGVAGQYSWLQTSKSVGSVSAAYGIPDSVLSNPDYSMLTKTTYGAKLLFKIHTLLVGNYFTVQGTTRP